MAIRPAPSCADGFAGCQGIEIPAPAGHLRGPAMRHARLIVAVLLAIQGLVFAALILTVLGVW